jgi:hypothetical protein
VLVPSCPLHDLTHHSSQARSFRNIDARLPGPVAAYVTLATVNMIQPGLERIGQLLKDVQFPWRAIHVAGTNGKGSICHHATALLRHRVRRVGKFTSPHLVDRYAPDHVVQHRL